MSELKHFNEIQLRKEKDSLEKHIEGLKAKLSGKKERLRWINYYLSKIEMLRVKE